MLHAKFDDSCSGEEDFKDFYGHGGYLGNVTLTIYINFGILYSFCKR